MDKKQDKFAMSMPTSQRCLPSLSLFKDDFAIGKTQLVYRWISSDLETAVSAYLKLCGRDPYSFLLESVEGGDTLGRYSVIGCQPDLLWKCSNAGDIVETSSGAAYDWVVASGVDGKTSLKSVIEESSLDAVPDDLPPMCAWGMFGYIGYDMVRLSEDVADDNPDDMKVPDSILMRPSILVIFDNVKRKMCVASPVYDNADTSPKQDAEIFYDEAVNRIDDAVAKLYGALDRKLLSSKSNLSPAQDITSNTDKGDYLKKVEKGVEYIHAGEIFQVVLSQRFSTDFDLPSFELYRSLRSVNPSPFMFHLAFEGFSVVGASPEVLVRVRDNKVTIRPIAGTRKRGEDASEDDFLANDLLSDEKECAEHLMLLDLGRNDVGRVAEIGSVNVTDKFNIELYSHVMHIVSNVEGELRNDCDVIDALFAGFPAGTVSGAPKVRAMEIIDELEISRRAVYAGGIGYFSKNSMDSCIALRTAVVKDNKLYVQAGGGIVADSQPEMEYQECCNKAKAIFHAAEITLKKFQ